MAATCSALPHIERGCADFVPSDRTCAAPLPAELESGPANAAGRSPPLATDQIPRLRSREECNRTSLERTMDLRSILLLLDEGPLCEARTRFALGLARAHGSHLVGLAPTGFADFPVAVDGAASLIEY